MKAPTTPRTQRAIGGRFRDVDRELDRKSESTQQTRVVGDSATDVRRNGGGSHEVRVIGGGTHEVRLIGGLWKRSKLPVANRPGLRPTPDRVRETLFNWLGQDLTGWRVIDAFAGSGALGFEAASRGAASVLLVERDATLVKSLRAVQQRLAAAMVRVEPGDGVAALARAAPGQFELVLLDPPYDAGLLDRALAAAVRTLAPGGFIYAESPTALRDLPAGIEIHRTGRAGAVHYQLLRAAPTLAAPEAVPEAALKITNEAASAALLKPGAQEPAQ